MNIEKDDLYVKAKKRVQNLKAFYVHVAVYLLVNIMLFINNMWTSPGYWWFIYPLVGWGIFIVVQAIGVKYGSDWEERKIEQYMDKYN